MTKAQSNTGKVHMDTSLSAWYDSNSDTWTYLAELSRTDPETAANLLQMWRAELGYPKRSTSLPVL